MSHLEEEKCSLSQKRSIKDRMREQQRQNLSQLPRERMEQNTKELMQMSLAVMPLSISDELRKKKKVESGESTGRAAGTSNPALMVKHPLYTNMLEAARMNSAPSQGIIYEGQCIGNYLKIFHLNQQLLNLYQIRKRLVEKLQRERWILAFREFAAYLDEGNISPELIQKNLRPEPNSPESDLEEEESESDVHSNNDLEENENKSNPNTKEKPASASKEETLKVEQAPIDPFPGIEEIPIPSLSLEQFKSEIPFDVRLYTKALVAYDFIFQFNTLLGIPLFPLDLVSAFLYKLVVHKRIDKGRGQRCFEHDPR